MTPDDILLFAVEQKMLPAPLLLPFPCGCTCQPEYFLWDDGPHFGIKGFIPHISCLKPYHCFERMKHITQPLTQGFVKRAHAHPR